MTGFLILFGGIALFGVTMAFLQWLFDRREEREKRAASRKHA